MDAETKKMWAGIIYGGMIVIAVIAGIILKDLVVTGTILIIENVIIIYVDNTIRKILKKYTGITDEELDDIEGDLSGITGTKDDPKPEPTPPTPQPTAPG